MTVRDQVWIEHPPAYIISGTHLQFLQGANYIQFGNRSRDFPGHVSLDYCLSITGSESASAVY